MMKSPAFLINGVSPGLGKALAAMAFSGRDAASD
jgi:hypothetical protein